MRTLLSLTLSVFIALPLVAHAFSDVPSSHPHKTAIDYVSDRTIMNGYSPEEFGPERFVNRAEIAAIIARALYPSARIEQCTQAEYLFPDTPINEWFGKVVCLLNKEGIISGHPSGLYKPADTVSFVELAKITVLAYDLSAEEAEIWYEGYVRALEEWNAIPTDIKALNAPATRAQVAEVIYRLAALVTDKPSLTLAELQGKTEQPHTSQRSSIASSERSSEASSESSVVSSNTSTTPSSESTSSSTATSAQSSSATSVTTTGGNSSSSTAPCPVPSWAKDIVKIDGSEALVRFSALDASGVPLSDIKIVRLYCTEEDGGIRLVGETGDSINTHIALDGNLKIDLFLSKDPFQWSAELSGGAGGSFEILKFAFAGVDASIKLSPEDGVLVSGTVNLGGNTLTMGGSIDRNGPNLSGELSLVARLSVIGGIITTVTDGVVCGYHYVEDGAKCGFHQVVDGAKCGYEKVTDAVLCGTEYLACGTEWVWETVTSGAKCGFDTIGSCLGSIFSGNTDGCTKKPKSCSVRTQKTLYCHKPKSCTDLSKPKSCRVAKSCEDLSKPKTCEKNVVDADIGDVRGTLGLNVGTSGVKGVLKGDYCLGSNCTGVESDLKLYKPGPPPEFCFDIFGITELIELAGGSEKTICLEL